MREWEPLELGIEIRVWITYYAWRAAEYDPHPCHHLSTKW